MNETITTRWQDFTYRITFVNSRAVSILRSKKHSSPADPVLFDDLPFLLQQRIELHIHRQIDISVAE